MKAQNTGDIPVLPPSNLFFQVYLVTRRGTWVFNRVYDYGIPFDIALNRRSFFHLRKIVPAFLTNYVAEAKLNSRFDHARYGLKPAHSVFG